MGLVVQWRMYYHLLRNLYTYVEDLANSDLVVAQSIGWPLNGRMPDMHTDKALRDGN